MSTGRLGAGDTAIQPTIFDAKADILTATAADTPARLAVGNNGETLVADSSASTGLRWQGNYAAGKNVIINGDFNIWQRGTSQSVTLGAPTYGSADRWVFARNGTDGTGTNTVTRENHTVGQTDVPNNPTFFCRWTATTLATSQTRVDFNQYVENVNTFASQTVTFSFYVKSSGTFSISTFFEQNFGSGGSTLVTTTAGTGNTSTSWTRFTTTVTLPSISGKTVGTSNYLRVLIRFNNPTAGATFDVSNVQLEAGNVATAFQTATGTLAGELAACQRYYTLLVSGSNKCITMGYYQAAGDFRMTIELPVVMRAVPTLSTTSGSNYYRIVYGTDDVDGLGLLGFGLETERVAGLYVSSGTISGTAGTASIIQTNNASAFLAVQAEL